MSLNPCWVEKAFEIKLQRKSRHTFRIKCILLEHVDVFVIITRGTTEQERPKKSSTCNFDVVFRDYALNHVDGGALHSYVSIGFLIRCV